MASCREADVCKRLLKDIDTTLDPLTAALKDSQEAFVGSEQERDALDKAYIAQQKATALLTQLEEQMVPDNYVTPVPPEYSDLPQLKKRATVEMIIKKGQQGVPFDVNGVNFPEAKLVMVIDGYTGTCNGGDCHTPVSFSVCCWDSFCLLCTHPDTHSSSCHGWKLCGFGAKGFL